MLNFQAAIEKYTYRKLLILDGLVDDESLDKCIFCPDCLSLNTKANLGCCTCVGGTPDPNHYWRSGECLDCGRKYSFEHHLWYADRKSTNIWYTELIDNVDIPYNVDPKARKDTLVTLGISNCCESSSYYGCRCDTGLIKLIIEDLHGNKTNIRSYNFERRGRCFKEFIVCNKCGLKEEVNGI